MECSLRETNDKQPEELVLFPNQSFYFLPFVEEYSALFIYLFFLFLSLTLWNGVALYAQKTYVKTLDPPFCLFVSGSPSTEPESLLLVF